MSETIRPQMTTLHRNEEGLKWCPGLAGSEPHWLEEEGFTAYRRNLDGLQNSCRSCHRADKRLRNFGVTPQAYEAAYERQGGCAICWEPGDLDVDHCHTSGAVRGLLCRPCNLALGWLDDDVERALDLFLQLLEGEALDCRCTEVEGLCTRCKHASSRLARDEAILCNAVSYLRGENAEAAAVLVGGQ